MKNRTEGNLNLKNYNPTNLIHPTSTLLILYLFFISVNCSYQQDDQDQLYFLGFRDSTLALNNDNNDSQILEDQTRKRELFLTEPYNDNYIYYDNSQILELDINEEFKFALKGQNSTFLIKNFNQYQYLYIELDLENSEDISQLDASHSPSLYANFDKPPYYYTNDKNEKQLRFRFFDSNGFYLKKKNLYLIISKEQYSFESGLYITLLLDQSKQYDQQFSYKYKIKITGHINSKPCPFGCSSNKGQCIEGVCQCASYYIDEDCSQSSYKVDISSNQFNQFQLKPDVINYVYMNVDQLLTNQQLTVTLSVNSTLQTICILYQRPLNKCSNQSCTVIPSYNDYNSTLCLQQSSEVSTKEYILTDSPSYFKKGQKIIVGLYLKDSYEEQQINFKMQLISEDDYPSIESDDIVTIISIVCSFLVTFTIIFICFQYCKNRQNQQNNNQLPEMSESSISEPSIIQEIKKDLISKKKLDKKILDKYLPAQLWEDAKQILLKQKREIVEPFSCLLCHLNIEKGEKVRVSICFHVLHVECFDQWFISKEFCPMCRREHKLSDLENHKKGINNNEQDEYMFEMAKQFDMITKTIHSTEANQNTQLQKKNSFIQQFNVNITNPSTSNIQMQEMKANNGVQSYKQFSQGLPYQNSLIYYKNTFPRKLTINVGKNKNQTQDTIFQNTINSPTYHKDEQQAYPKQMKNGFQQLDENSDSNNSSDFKPNYEKSIDLEGSNKIQKQFKNSTDLSVSPTFTAQQSSPISQQRNQIGKLFQRNRLNSCSSDSNSPNSAGINQKKYKNNNKSNKMQEIFIKEVEIEDDDNPSYNQNFDKRDSFLGDNQTLNYIQELDNQDEINNTNINFEQNNNRNKKFSISSVGSDLSFFSPINIRKYRESTIKIFENEGSLNLDLYDQRFNESTNTSQHNKSNYQKNLQINNSPRKIKTNNQQMIVSNALNFGQSIILETLENSDNNNYKNKTLIKNLLPQDQL